MPLAEVASLATAAALAGDAERVAADWAVAVARVAAALVAAEEALVAATAAAAGALGPRLALPADSAEAEARDSVVGLVEVAWMVVAATAAVAAGRAVGVAAPTAEPAQGSSGQYRRGTARTPRCRRTSWADTRATPAGSSCQGWRRSIGNRSSCSSSGR